MRQLFSRMKTRFLKPRLALLPAPNEKLLLDYLFNALIMASELF